MELWNVWLAGSLAVATRTKTQPRMLQVLMSVRTSVQPAGGVSSAPIWFRFARCASSTLPAATPGGVERVRLVTVWPLACVVPTKVISPVAGGRRGRSTTACVMLVLGSVELPVKAGWAPAAPSSEVAALCSTPRDDETRQVSSCSVKPVGGVWTAGHAAPPQTWAENHTARPFADDVVATGSARLALLPFFWPTCTSNGWSGSAPDTATRVAAMELARSR